MLGFGGLFSVKRVEGDMAVKDRIMRTTVCLIRPPEGVLDPPLVFEFEGVPRYPAIQFDGDEVKPAIAETARKLRSRGMSDVEIVDWFLK